MSAPRPFVVYARNRGRHAVRAHSARHAVAAVVARLKLSEREAVETCAWCVTENPELYSELMKNGNPQS